MEKLLEKYKKLGIVKIFSIMNLTMIDVDWSGKFEGGKPERNKLIYLLKKNGYQHQNSYYVKMN
jgi:hypothetical protein